jgi:hypothetical protein
MSARPIGQAESNAVVIVENADFLSRLCSEPGKFLNAVNRRTKYESSERTLKNRPVSSDFDSAIRRFDPSRPSQGIRAFSQAPYQARMHLSP